MLMLYYPCCYLLVILPGMEVDREHISPKPINWKLPCGIGIINLVGLYYQSLIVFLVSRGII